MGLLDALNTDQGRLGIGLLAAAQSRGDGMGFGGRIQEALGSVDAWKKQQVMQKLQELQMQEAQAAMADKASQRQQMAAKLLEDQRLQDLFRNAGNVPLNMQGTAKANDLLPSELRIGAQAQLQQPGKVDFNDLRQRGMPFEMLKHLAETQNLGRDEVARVEETTDAQGRPIKRQLSKFGDIVAGNAGDLPQWKAPISESLGDRRALIDPVTRKEVASFGVGQSPDSKASNALGWANYNLSKENKAAELAGQEEAFTPAAIANAAARYNIDGTLPAMGMGKTAAMGRSAILNKAAELAGASGKSGDQQRIEQIGNKANTAALSKLQQSQTMVGAFEKNFTKNADLALEYSTKIDPRTGVPLINKWINSGKRAITGDPELSAYDAIVKSTANEYAKIISGSMGNTALAEGEIKKIENLLNAAQTPAQVTEVIKVMKRETQNRMKGFEEEKATWRGSMTGQKPAHGMPAASTGWSIQRVD